MKRLFVLALAIGLALPAFACAPYTPPANSASAQPLEDQIPVMYKNLDLKLYVHVRDFRTERVNGLLVGKLMLENKKGSDLPVDVKAKWLDKDGYEIKDSWGARPVVLKAGEINSIEFIAPDPAAESVRFIIANSEMQ
ncbi:MAG: DUF1425 domain-containing protein [Myxococcales bacterium]|nr:DUF1425 domain-containing protein [Myxococcales bacterium]